MAQSDSLVNHFKMIKSQLLIRGVIATEIKTDGNTSERLIKIQRQAFDVLFITHATWHHLGGPSTI